MFTSMILMAMIGLPMMLVPLSDSGAEDAEDATGADATAEIDTGFASAGEQADIVAIDSILDIDTEGERAAAAEAEASEASDGDIDTVAGEEAGAIETQPQDSAGRIVEGSVMADVMTGGAGDDELSGYHGDDTLSGEAGDDLLRGGYGNDTLLGGAGDDNLNGNVGDDFLDGGVGNDRIDGGEGDNTLVGGEGADLLMATWGNDLLNGNEDDGSSDDDIDRLIASFGDDTLMLGEGDIGEGGAGADTHYILSDVDLGVTITDFNPSEDNIVVLHDQADVPTIVEQRIDATGVTVVLSTGVEISLNGLESTVPAAQFGFEAFGAAA